MTTAHLALIPRDGLFCKDGRDWHTSSSGRGHGLDWPWPSTVLGALRTASGRIQETLRNSQFERADWHAHTRAVTLSRTLVLRRPLVQMHAARGVWEVHDRVWPAPADARRLEGHDQLVALAPQPAQLPTLGRDDDDVREALWAPLLPDKAKPLGTSRWWSEARFAAWLAGAPVSAAADGDAFEPVRRIQAHVKIRADLLTAEDGALYSHDIVETIEGGAEWALGIEAELPDSMVPTVASLGSDSRLAIVERIPPSLFEPPASILDAFRPGVPGLRLVVVSPARFGRGWLPSGFAPRDRELRGRLPGCDTELVLRAAIVPRPVYVSGWDMAEGRPKPTSAHVPPGAVYFFQRVDQRPFGESDARSLWLTAIGQRVDHGYGRVVPAIWHPPRTTS